MISDSAGMFVTLQLKQEFKYLGDRGESCIQIDTQITLFVLDYHSFSGRCAVVFWGNGFINLLKVMSDKRQNGWKYFFQRLVEKRTFLLFYSNQAFIGVNIGEGINQC